VIAHYERRAAAAAERRDAEQITSKRLSRLRLATFIPGAVLVLWGLSRDITLAPIAAGVALLFVFAVLVFWHARVEERVSWFDAVHVFNMQGLARIGRAWDRLPLPDPPLAPGGEPIDLEHHPYANDLDLFGRASLMQWLGPAATEPGARTLQHWLLAPSAPDTIQVRQEAVAELAPALAWREELGAHGRLASAIRAHELEQFLRWAEGPGAFAPATVKALTAVAALLVVAIWVLIRLDLQGVTPASFWLLPLSTGIVLSYATMWRIQGEFMRAGAAHHAFARYADLFEHARAAPAGGASLQALHARFGAAGVSAPASMRRLNRILGFARLASGAGIFHFVVQSITLWDFFVFFSLDRWRRQAGSRTRDWMRALGELDALAALARIAAENPSWAMPRVTEGDPELAAEKLGHPLISDDRRVGNDVTVGPPGTLLLITGSNMSGKSTLLRSIGLNAVLAQAGGPACAASLHMPPVDLETSIRVHDSLEHGLSYFMAALARLKGVIDRADRAGGGLRVLYLLDEILSGTNTAERAIAVRGVARRLLQSGAIGVITTHDLAVANEEPLDTAARLGHFTELVDASGGMTFDYRLRPGLATSRNALRLMKLIGIELDERASS
jgi:hypothetical protein